MRIVTVVLPVAMALLVLSACVSRVAPTADPSVLPSRSPVPGECAATDIDVTGRADEKPVVRVPTDCAAPTTALGRDLTVGRGEQAVRGCDLEVAYVMVAWTGGVVVESTWAGTTSSSVTVTDLGDAGWQEGMLGIREGGRRLFVAPPDASRGETGAGETVIYVLDAIRVD